MKKLSIYVFGILLTGFLYSCEDVIELDLTDAEQRIIIEAQLNTSTETATVTLSKSNGFYDNGDPEMISDAVIVLSGPAGSTFTLTEQEDGIYSAESIATTPGDIFTLSVQSDGNTYTASTMTPYPAALDTLEVSKQAFPFGQQDSIIQVNAQWEDLLGSNNYYRLRPFVNDTLVMGEYMLLDDKYNDGSEFNIPVRSQFEDGQKITIQLLSVDEEYYKYFGEVSAVSGEGFGGTTPFNPTGNFDNNALGYFGIFSLSEKTVQL